MLVTFLVLKVKYHANENTLKILAKIAYISQRLMYPMIKKKKTLPCQFLGFYIKKGSF